MASENNLNSVFTDIANSIRNKKGTSNTMKPINMADEINSIKVGDTNFKDLVERTITNVDDDTITTIGAYAFYNCKNLTTADFKSATNVFQYAFEGCSSLINVDFTNLTNIKWNVFIDCSSLTTLILRTNQVCTLSNTNAFSSTPIATSEIDGYIYVPLSLTENYRSATNWTTYKSKIMPIDLLEGNYVEVDLGTLNWSKDEVGRMRSNGISSLVYSPSAPNKIAYVICSKYPTKTADQTYSKNEGVSVEVDGIISIYDSSYTDATTFKNAMSGIILRYLPR